MADTIVLGLLNMIVTDSSLNVCVIQYSLMLRKTYARIFLIVVILLCLQCDAVIYAVKHNTYIVIST
jgi:hypothetical protein